MIIILNDIKDLSLLLDEDIDKFELSDLGDANEVISDRVLQESLDTSSSNNQCAVVSKPNNLSLRKRCSQACKKGTSLCHKHWKDQLKGKDLILVESMKY